MQELSEQRRALRDAAREARARIVGDRRADATSTVVTHLLDLPEIRVATRVLLTAAVGDELDLSALRTALLARGTTVALPVVDGDDLVTVDITDATELRPGWGGVPEPVGPPAGGPPDVVVLPGLVMDRSGGRLGYGGGHFDRFLSGPAAGATTIGAVFHAQLVDRVPVLPHDVQLDVVVTERGVWRRDHVRG